MLNDLCFAHDMLHERVPVKFGAYFKFSNLVGRQASKYRLQSTKDVLLCRKYAFSKRIIPAWNIIPEEVIESSKPSFKLYLTNNRFILKLRRWD